MNQEREQAGIIKSLYDELDGLSTEDFGKRLTAFMDEQPHLTGFLFNLDEDFDEDQHTHILKTAIVVRDVLIGAGMPLEVADNSTIESVVQEKVEQFDTLGEEATQEEMLKLSSSPSILKKVSERSSLDTDLILVQDVIISVLEESVADQEKRKKHSN